MQETKINLKQVNLRHVRYLMTLVVEFRKSGLMATAAIVAIAASAEPGHLTGQKWRLFLTRVHVDEVL